MNVVNVGALATIPYIIIIIYYIKISKYFKDNQNSLSPASRKSQADLNRVLLAQAITPILFVVLPASVHVISGIGNFNLVFVSFVCGILYSWIPIGNALSILCFITAYRTKVKQLFFHMKSPLIHFLYTSPTETTNLN